LRYTAVVYIYPVICYYSKMLIPGEVCAELTAETAHRLRGGDFFTAFADIDTVAQAELRGCLGELEGKNRREIDETTLRNTSLARAMIFFTRDTSGNMYAVPWVRSPQMPPHERHSKIGEEFMDFTSKTYENVKLDIPLDTFPDLVEGLIVPRDDDDSQLFIGIGHDYWDHPGEHTSAVKCAQQIVAEHGVKLHAQLGNVFLQADKSSI
jgi:hypothetical protein